MKKLILAAALSSAAFFAFGQELTAKQIFDNAVAKKSPEKAIEYINSQVGKITVQAEKRATYAFLGSIQETMALFADAQKSYATAAGIAGGNAEGMPKKSSERLVIDAIRCALSAGDFENADNYLNSAVRNSKNSEILVYIKLYEQWSALCRSESVQDTIEPLAMLKAYLELPSLQSVKPNILLTLWYLTGDSKYSDLLKKEFPGSSETGIVTGKVQVYPAPFWYFTPRKKAAAPEVELTSQGESQISVEKVVTIGKEEVAAIPYESKNTNNGAKKYDEAEKPEKQQLGLFRDKSNAQNFVSRVKEKGFRAYIQEETKESGITYFTVVVDETSDGTLADHLRSAGFECYPIFN